MVPFRYGSVLEIMRDSNDPLSVAVCCVFVCVTILFICSLPSTFQCCASTEHEMPMCGASSHEVELDDAHR